MMLKTKIIIILFSVGILGMSSCNLFKKNIKDDKTNEMTELKNITENVNKNSVQFQTFSANFTGKYSDNKQSLPLKGIIKIQKDKYIWLSIRPFLGIELARILLTPDTIKYINKVQKTFSTGNYNLLKKKYGLEINYKTVENLLMNKIFFYPSDKSLLNYKLLKEGNTNKIISESKINNRIIVHTIVTENNLLKKTSLKISQQNIEMKIIYDKFLKFNDKFFPEKLNIFAKKISDNMNVEILYKNINFDKDITIKFKIPSIYKEIKF